MKFKALPVNELTDATLDFEQLQQKAILDSTPQSFLQLATAGTRKLAFGTGTLTWPGGSPITNVLTVTHGLGTTPVVVLVISTDGTNHPYCISNAYTSTQFNTSGLDPFGSPALGQTSGIAWLAIG